MGNTFPKVKQNGEKVWNFLPNKGDIFTHTMKHRGEIVNKAVLESGISKSSLAKKLGRDRKTVYNYMLNADLALDIIVEIGKIIKYDFRKDFPELFIPQPENVVNESTESYGSLAECIKRNKELEKTNYSLLEEISQLKSQLLRK